MRYLRIQRNYEPIITVGEYIEAMDPKTFRKLKRIQTDELLGSIKEIMLTVKMLRDVTETVLAAGDVTGKDRYYESVMKERPKPGKGGLLPKEKESVLYE